VILRYAAAALSVIAALIILRWMEFVFQCAAHVSLFLCAVMFSAWYGGVGPGLLAVAVSALAFNYYFLPPIYSLAVEITQLPRLVLFAVSAVFVGSLSAAQRSAARSLRQARDDL
jgi:K+-sensing histidine kinase KdpD